MPRLMPALGDWRTWFLVSLSLHAWMLWRVQVHLQPSLPPVEQRIQVALREVEMPPPPPEPPKPPSPPKRVAEKPPPRPRPAPRLPEKPPQPPKPREEILPQVPPIPLPAPSEEKARPQPSEAPTPSREERPQWAQAESHTKPLEPSPSAPPPAEEPLTPAVASRALPWAAPPHALETPKARPGALSPPTTEETSLAPGSGREPSAGREEAPRLALAPAGSREVGAGEGLLPGAVPAPQGPERGGVPTAILQGGGIFLREGPLPQPLPGAAQVGKQQPREGRAGGPPREVGLGQGEGQGAGTSTGRPGPERATGGGTVPIARQPGGGPGGFSLGGGGPRPSAPSGPATGPGGGGLGTSRGSVGPGPALPSEGGWGLGGQGGMGTGPGGPGKATPVSGGRVERIGPPGGGGTGEGPGGARGKETPQALPIAPPRTPTSLASSPTPSPAPSSGSGRGSGSSGPGGGGQGLPAGGIFSSPTLPLPSVEAKARPGGLYAHVRGVYTLPNIRVADTDTRPGARDALRNLLREVSRRTNIRAQLETRESPLLLEELRDCPMLYITGHEPFEFTEEQREVLRQYVALGGTILGDNDHGPFDQCFQREVRRIFGQSLRPIPLSDEIYRAFYVLTSVPPGDLGETYPLLGIRQGNRWVVLYSRNDYGDCWAEGPAFEYSAPYREGAYQLGVNLFVYAVAQWQRRGR